MTRRTVFSAMTLAAAGSAVAAAEGSGRPRRLGLVIHSLWNRWQGKHSSVQWPPLTKVEEVLDLSLEQGFGGLQTTVADWTGLTARAIREFSESHDFFVEGSIELPVSRGELDRFERQVRLAKEAGVTVFCCYLGGRRYEDHAGLTSFKQYREWARERLGWVEAVLSRQRVRLGVENHKDFREEELAEVLGRLSSRAVGWCMDFGNNLALLEDAEAMLERLGPYLVTTHVKDMALQPDPVGFQMAEVPLGQGTLDLPGLIRRCEEANGQVRFFLEMITRDPLVIPCLEASYWRTLAGVTGEDLAAVLRLVRDHGAERMERVAGRSPEAVCRWEDEQNRACLKYAREVLGFD
jgi:sugar phosphate isomerase/epimerase